MRQIGRRALLIVMAVVLVMSLSAATGLAATGAFTVISSPNKGTSNNQLLGVTAASASSAWAVGYYQSAFCSCSQRTLGERGLCRVPNPGQRIQQSPVKVEQDDLRQPLRFDRPAHFASGPDAAISPRRPPPAMRNGAAP